MHTNLETPANKGGRITLFHVCVVSLSLLLTLSAWLFAKTQVETRNQLRFDAARDQALHLITDGMAKYEDALSAGVAAIESHGGDIAYADWRTFARNLRIDERYPGINGIGVVHFHGARTFGPYLADQQRIRPEFNVFPDHDFPIRMPITYIEPEDINAAAIGLDVAHEINRRTAALTSRDTGTAQITGPIVLVQDTGKTPGFLFLAPFYAGDRPDNIIERRQNIIGVIYAPFVVHKLMHGLLSKERRGVHFSIQDAGETIYDEHSHEDALNDPDPMFSETVTLDLYGRSWTVDVRTNLTFRKENSQVKPTFILLAGLVIETLIISLLYQMSQANNRAIAYAHKVTRALKKQSAKLVSTNRTLSQKNDELERFAYVASHDLRTPIRGIDGLTEMIEEDLEDYLASDAANPDVQINLARIHERVQRMENLTQGIMSISHMHKGEITEDPVDVMDILAQLELDFDLKEEQLHLSGDCVRIAADPTNFRSVLENLIGNAIKYHSGPDDLRIIVSVQPAESTLNVVVADNGPGIDPRHHDRIFDVFQTLNTNDDIESTGIGLSIVKKAVERHGGNVRIVSALDEGAAFHFDWPNKVPDKVATSEDKAA